MYADAIKLAEPILQLGNKINSGEFYKLTDHITSFIEYQDLIDLYPSQELLKRWKQEIFINI